MVEALVTPEDTSCDITCSVSGVATKLMRRASFRMIACALGKVWDY